MLIFRTVCSSVQQSVFMNMYMPPLFCFVKIKRYAVTIVSQRSQATSEFLLLFFLFCKEKWSFVKYLFANICDIFLAVLNTNLSTRFLSLENYFKETAMPQFCSIFCCFFLLKLIALLAFSFFILSTFFAIIFCVVIFCYLLPVF